MENLIEMPDDLEELPYEDYSKSKIRYDKLITDWSTDFFNVKNIRAQRYIEMDKQTARQLGIISESEILVPDRVIHANIRADLGNTMAFLNAGYRLGIFDCVSDPTTDTRELEIQVTRGLTYAGWYREFFRWADGAELFKFDHLEVVFDASKPMHVGFEHVGYNKLYFNKKSRGPRFSEIVIREYDVTPMQLEGFVVSSNFDLDQVQSILQTKENRRDETFCIYKIYQKIKGIIYVCWYSKDGAVTTWLKAPQKLRLGIYNKITDTNPTTQQPIENWQEQDIENVPIFTYLYQDDENEVLDEHKGRDFLDRPQQEFNTTVITAFANQLVKSGQTYGTPKMDTNDSAEIKQLDIELENGGVYDHAIDFWSHPAPEVTTLTALQYLDSRWAQQRGKIAASVSNRKDSRKTAEELKQAQGEETKVTSIELSTFSEALREVLNFAWKIIQSQALQNKIILLPVSKPIINPITKQPSGEKIENDHEVIAKEFEIRPAGDIDIIEAQQEQAKMQQDWPVFQNTALAPKFLQDYTRIRYPKRADEYVDILQQQQLVNEQTVQQAKGLVAGLATLLKAFMQPEELASLTPDKQQEVAQLQQQVNQMIGVQ